MPRHLRISVPSPAVDREGTPQADNDHESGAVGEALRDPTSPLYRSLSEIPTGLPPVSACVLC